jgi:aspartate aminotransferase
MRRVFLRRRDLAVRLLREIPGLKVNVPQGAFYLFPEIGAYLGKRAGDYQVDTVADLAMYLLEVGHVATVGGAAFGAPTCLRLSYATSDDRLAEAMDRMKQALAKLS